jgi:hypothetical protein
VQTTESQFADRLMSNDDYAEFRGLLRERSAMWHADSEPRGDRNILLTNCRVEFTPSMVVMAVGTRGDQDVEAEWRGILRLCNRYGFR